MADLPLTLITVLGVTAVGWLGWRAAGPMVMPELRRWTNRKPPYRNRLLLVGGLFGLLAIMYFDGFASAEFTTIPKQAKFAHSCFVRIIVIELIAVAVFTPAAVAPAISAEKDDRSVELLWVTPLSAREILFGKLAARMTPVFDLILASLPVVAVLQFFGGVGFAQVALGFVTVLITAVGYAALTTAFATEASPRGTLLMTYGAMAICCAVPAGTMATAFARYAESGESDSLSAWGMTGLMILGFAGVLLLSAWATIGPPRVERLPTPAAPPEPMSPPPAASLRSPRIEFPRPPMGDRPLFWKEQHGDRGLETELVFNISILSLVLAAIAGLMTVAMGVIELLSSGTWDPESFAIVEMIATPGLIVVAALAVGFGTALSVIAERERGTLTVLLTIPEPRSAILSAKLNGNLWRVRYFAATLVVLWLFGLILGVVGPLEFLGRVLMTAALLDAIGRIGMSISVGTRNASAALLALMVVYVLGGIAVIWCVVALGITGLYISAAAVWLVGRLGWRGAVDAFEREEPS